MALMCLKILFQQIDMKRLQGNFYLPFSFSIKDFTYF